MYKRVVRVIYPLEAGRIVLGTGSTWDDCIEPSAVSGGGQVYEFTLTSERPFLYCKPCIVSHTGARRACGPGNLVLLTQPGSRDIYPHFFAGEGGDISPVFRNDSSALGRQHLFRVYLPPGYGENTLKRYPVLYMQDGKNLFFPKRRSSAPTGKSKRH